MKSISILLLSAALASVYADKALFTLYSVASEAEEQGPGPRDTILKSC